MTESVATSPPPHRYLATRSDIDAVLAEWGEPRYRGQQLWDGLYGQRRPLDAISEIAKSLRTRLVEALPTALVPVTEQRSKDLTVKWLFAAGTAQVETVLMESKRGGRATVCVSSQAGCAMACSFCATGQAGFDRHLDAGEIVEQVLRAQHTTETRVSNVVFMGMGEPLVNLDAVLPAIDRLHGDCGISARQITVSTVGIVPGIERLADYPLPVTLAVSLHAPDDALRNEIAPINRRYPIADVLDAARAYAERKGRRVTFEYACIEGVNIAPSQARTLADRLRRFPAGAHVNLIPLNQTDAYPRQAAATTNIRAFADILESSGVRATLRHNRGRDIEAACGQLRARSLTEPESVETTMTGTSAAGPSE